MVHRSIAPGIFARTSRVAGADARPKGRAVHAARAALLRVVKHRQRRENTAIHVAQEMRRQRAALFISVRQLHGREVRAGLGHHAQRGLDPAHIAQTHDAAAHLVEIFRIMHFRHVQSLPGTQIAHRSLIYYTSIIPVLSVSHKAMFSIKSGAAQRHDRRSKAILPCPKAPLQPCAPSQPCWDRCPRKSSDTAPNG